MKPINRMGCFPYVWIIILAAFYGKGLSYNLTAPENYTVFSGDIRVHYALPIHVPLQKLIVQLYSASNRDVITSMGLPSRRTGVLPFLCGILDHDGLYIFELQDQNSGRVLTRSRVMTAVWPDIIFTLPTVRLALTGSVTLRLVKTDAKCRSKSKRSKYWIDVIYQGKNPTDGNPWITPAVVDKRNILDLSKMSNEKFDCDVFDQAGYYQAILRSSYDPTGYIAKSGRLSVKWSNQMFGLEAMTGSIFPCTRVFRMQYKHPPCPGSRDKMRMYKIKQEAVASVASPRKLEYIIEKNVDAPGREGILEYTCDLFEEGVAAYCFRYVSISRTGGVQDQDTICVPSKEDIGVVINGGWSNWSSWTMCNSDNGVCGTGRQSRYRLCNSPPPSGGGSYCSLSGETLTWQNCNVPCRDDTNDGQNDTIPTTIAPMNPNCRCGCNLTSSQAIFESSGRCPPTSIWLIRVKHGRRIVLEFDLFDLDPDLQQFVVRDGVGDHRSILVRNTGNDRPGIATSSKNIVLVELKTLEKGLVMGRGFKVTYRTIADNATANESPYVNPVETTAVDWQTPLVVIGTLICVIVVACGGVYVFYYRRLRKEGKLYYPTAHSKGEIVESTSMQSADGAETATFDVAVVTAEGGEEHEGVSGPKDGDTKADRLSKKGRKVDKVRTVAGAGDDDDDEEEAAERRRRRKQRRRQRKSKVIEEEEEQPAGSPSLHPLLGERNRPTLIKDTAFIEDNPEKSTIKRSAAKRGSVDQLESDKTDLLQGKRAKGSPSMSPKSQRSISRSLKSLRSLSQSTKSLRDALKPLSFRTSQRPTPDGQSPDARSMRDLSPTSPSDAHDFTPLMSRKKHTSSRSNLSRASSKTSGFSVAFDGFEFDDTIHYEPGSYFQSDDLFLDPCELDWQGGTVKQSTGEADPAARAALDEKLKAFQMDL